MTGQSKSAATGGAPRRGRPPLPGARDGLLDAGLALMHERGYAATGVADIVARAGLPKGTFYNHFDTKEAFGADVVDRFFARIAPAFERHAADQSRTPRQRLRAYFADRARRLAETGFARGCLLGNLALEIGDHSEAVRLRIQAHLDAWAARMATCLRAGQRSGDVRADVSALRLARRVIASWEGALIAMRAERSARPLDDFAAMLDDLLAPRPARARRAKGASR
jgi:TetR/AcrR family transcriptional regulator, transcriptional repressor for nem operon